MYKNRTTYSLVAIILFIIVILVVSYHGKRTRIFAPGETTLTVDTPEKAYAIWQEKKVKGRILILFDNYPHAKGLRSYDNAPLLTAFNVVEFSIFKNIVRKIYLIVPDSNWDAFRSQKEMGPIREVPDVEKGEFLYYKSGVPLIAITPSSLPHISEKALVYINSRVFTSEHARELLATKNTASDIIITYQGQNR